VLAATASKRTPTRSSSQDLLSNAEAVSSTARSGLVRFFSSSNGLISTTSKLNMPPLGDDFHG